MHDDTSQREARARSVSDPGRYGADSARAVGNSIRQAFLTHMGEQQRQYPTALATSSRRAGERRQETIGPGKR